MIVCYYIDLMVEDSFKKRRDDLYIPPNFSEIQYFRSNKAMYLAYLALFGAMVAILVQIGKLQSRGIKPTPLYFALGVVALVCLIIFSMKMTTEVNIYEAKFIMFPFMFKAKRYQLSEIEKVNVTEYHPILEYGGWGIRYGTNKMWAYAVYGNRGVTISLKSGKIILLGSQRPEELARSIVQPL